MRANLPLWRSATRSHRHAHWATKARPSQAQGFTTTSTSTHPHARRTRVVQPGGRRARHIVSTIRTPLYFKICQNIRAAQQPNRKWPQLHVYRPKHALRTYDSRIDRGDPDTEPPAHCHRDT